MKRPMCILAVSWLAGLMLAGREPVIGTIAVLFIYLFLIILGLLILKKHPKYLESQVQSEWYPQLTLLLLLIPCLFWGGYWRGEQEITKQKEQELPWRLLVEERDAYVTVEGIVKEKRQEEQVLLELTDCMLVGFYGEENKPAGDCRVTVDKEGKEWLPETFVGNKIRVFGKCSIFRPASNPGQFDAYDYYTGQGLYADVTALRITVLDAGKAMPGHAMFVLKQNLRESITALYPAEKAGVLAAMILGDKDLLSEEVEDLYRQNGISHILAISGLHISMLCMGLFELLRKLMVPQKTAMAVAVAFLAFYVAFSGVGTSSLRAGIMCLILFGARLFRRSYDLLSSLSLAAIVVTLLRPQELTSAGFLLSFGAVLGVAVAKEVEYTLFREWKGKRPWWSILISGGMIQCVTMPISLWFFYELSPYGILLNLVVIPLISLILGGGILSSLLGLFLPVAARIPSGGTYVLLEFYERICWLTQKLPFSFVLVGRPEMWQLVVDYGMLVVVLKVFFVRACKIAQQEENRNASGHNRVHFGANLTTVFAVGLLCTATILFLPDRQSTEILFLDVSQGDSALISTADGTVILSDCGSSDVPKVGEYRLSPVLKQNGSLLIDMAVVSHLDSDHTSGIKELLEAMPVYTGRTRYAANYKGVVGIAELVLPEVKEKSEAYLELEALALKKNVAVRYVQAGEQLYREENLLIECLHPNDARESENDTSLVFLLQTPELIAWLMGDAGTAPETEIMEHLAAVNMGALRKNRLVLLKVGHHGSKTSSGQEFIDYVQPDISVISCGYRNSYGHPHAEVVERLKAVDSQVFRTDLQGAIVVEFSPRHGVRVRSWTKNQRK